MTGDSNVSVPVVEDLWIIDADKVLYIAVVLISLAVSSVEF